MEAAEAALSDSVQPSIGIIIEPLDVAITSLLIPFPSFPIINATELSALIFFTETAFLSSAAE